MERGLVRSIIGRIRRLPLRTATIVTLVGSVCLFGWIFNALHVLHELEATTRQELTTQKRQKAINYTYYRQWYGSSLIKKEFRVNAHSPCSIPSMFFVWNHKTGGFFKDWLQRMEQNCGVSKHIIRGPDFLGVRAQCPGPYWTIYDVHSDEGQKCVGAKVKKIEGMIKGTTVTMLGVMDTDPSSLFAGVRAFERKRSTEDYAVIMMVRKPLDVILSAYNYHASGKEKSWTSKSFLREDYPVYYCFRNVWNPQEHVIPKSSNMYDEYKKGFINNYRDHEALQRGLYFEFTRFINCEWPLHFEMYQEIKNNVIHQYKWSLFLRFEWFSEYNYAESIRFFLQQIGESEHEHRILTESNPLDKCSTTGITNTEECEHMSRGKYDKEMQIKLLLEYDERICPLLRNMTLSMDGKWVGMEPYC